MGNSLQLSNLASLPRNIAFSHGFIYLETEKNVYYPGEIIKGSVHLLINKSLSSKEELPVKSLELRLRGKETFKFKRNRREDLACKNHFIIIDNTQILAHF